MPARPAALLTFLLLPSFALAGDRSDAMLDLLGRVPTEALEAEPGSYAQVHFVDNLAAARVAERHPGDKAALVERVGAYARAATAELGPSVLLGLDGAWRSLVGFAPSEVEAQLGYSDPPDGALLLRLDPAATGRVGPALLANGYAEAERDGLRALARGEEDGALDFARRDPADPFGGALGRSSRVAVEGAYVLQGATWPALLGLSGRGGPQGHPDLAVLAQAIDLPDWGGTEVVQAMALPHQLDISPGGTSGLPLWRLGLLVDLDSGDERLTLAVLSYTSRADAEAAAQRIEEGWDEAPSPSAMDEILAAAGGEAQPGRSPAELTLAEVTTGVVGEGPFATWAAIRQPPETAEDWLENPTFQRLVRPLFSRELALFGPV